MESKEQLDFILRVLRIFESADCQSELFWRFDMDYPGQLKLLAMCNDLFWWATSDCEEITHENIEILENTGKELKTVEYDLDESIKNKWGLPEGYLSELFAARSRKMRPQQPCYKTMSPVIAELFNACGPVRNRADED